MCVKKIAQTTRLMNTKSENKRSSFFNIVEHQQRRRGRGEGLEDGAARAERLEIIFKADSHKLRLMNAAAVDGCIATAEIGNFSFFAHTLLSQPHTSNSACGNQPLNGPFPSSFSLF